MRLFAAFLLTSITSAFAYTITSPGASTNWTTYSTNIVKWIRVDTDPSNFTVVLINMNSAVMPQGPQVLNALVDGSSATEIVCNPPSGGWPQGSGFRVNFARDAESLDALLAQSDPFSIVPPTSSMVSSTSSGSSSTSSSLLTAQTTPATSTTTSDTSTTPTGTNAAIIGMNVGTGLLTAIAALTAFVNTNF